MSLSVSKMWAIYARGEGWEGETYVFQDIPVVEFMYLVFTHMPGENYRRKLRSYLLCLCVTSFER